MSKFLKSLCLVLVIIGIAGAVASGSDALIALKGKTVDLNEAVRSDFDEKAMIEGEAYFVYDCIATEEVTRTTYGIKTGSTETNFYLIESYDKDWFMDEDAEYEPLTLIYSTANKDQIAKLDGMVDAWNDYYEKAYAAETEEEFAKVPVPTETFDIKGVITTYSDSQLIDFRNEYIQEMGYEGSELDDYLDKYCVDMIIDNSNPQTSIVIFFVSIAIAVLGIAIFIISIVKAKRRSREEFY